MPAQLMEQLEAAQQIFPALELQQQVIPVSSSSFLVASVVENQLKF
jgi:hypothetical protein